VLRQGKVRFVPPLKGYGLWGIQRLWALGHSEPALHFYGCRSSDRMLAALNNKGVTEVYRSATQIMCAKFAHRKHRSLVGVKPAAKDVKCLGKAVGSSII
jgi:hypothetical protein